MLYILSTYSYKIPKFFSQIINYFKPKVGVDVFFIENIQVVPAVEFKKHILYIGIFCIIISEFRCGQEVCLVVLFVINESSKISFYHSVFLLILAIGLRVENSREFWFNA